HVKAQGHEPEQPGRAARLGAPCGDFLGCHGCRHARNSAHQCGTPLATSSRDGGSVQLWYGGGELSSHSRPLAPSQERSAALVPAFTHFQMMYGKRSCERPKPKAPMDDTMFQSANCVE